jgi:hypothetical protein
VLYLLYYVQMERGLIAMNEKTVFEIIYAIASNGTISQKELMKRVRLTTDQLDVIIGILSGDRNNLVYEFHINDETMYMATVEGMQWYNAYKNKG